MDDGFAQRVWAGDNGIDGNRIKWKHVGFKLPNVKVDAVFANDDEKISTSLTAI